MRSKIFLREAFKKKSVTNLRPPQKNCFLESILRTFGKEIFFLLPPQMLKYLCMSVCPSVVNFSKVPEDFLRFLKVQGRFREGSGRAQGRFIRKVLGKFQESFRGGSGKVQGSCKNVSGKFQESFREGSGKFPESF